MVFLHIRFGKRCVNKIFSCCVFVLQLDFCPEGIPVRQMQYLHIGGNQFFHRIFEIFSGIVPKDNPADSKKLLQFFPDVFPTQFFHTISFYLIFARIG